jgi:hypothetical protein
VACRRGQKRELDRDPAAEPVDTSCAGTNQSPKDAPTAPAYVSLEALHDGRSRASEAWMRRREFSTLLGGAAAAAWPFAARAQQSVKPVLGVVSISGREATFNSIWYRAFLERLPDHGWTPGRNLSIEYRFADNKPSQLPALVKDPHPPQTRRHLCSDTPGAPCRQGGHHHDPRRVCVARGPARRRMDKKPCKTRGQSDRHCWLVPGARRETPRVIARIGSFAVEGRGAEQFRQSQRGGRCPGDANGCATTGNVSYCCASRPTRRV